MADAEDGEAFTSSDPRLLNVPPSLLSRPRRSHYIVVARSEPKCYMTSKNHFNDCGGMVATSKPSTGNDALAPGADLRKLMHPYSHRLDYEEVSNLR